MTKVCWAAVAALFCIAPPAFADAVVDDDRFLGATPRAAQDENYLPYTRTLSTSGTVDGSLLESARAIGLPAGAAQELAQAFAGALDLEEDLTKGDSFAVRYRQEYTLKGHPIGTPIVLWAELRTAIRGNFSVHRFRPARSKQESLWLATGEGAGPTALRWPVDDINISSGFGLRPNPMLKVGRAKGGPAARARQHGLRMHHGVDFAAETGTPIYAAAAGTVTGARPNGGYGNWIEINHEGGFETIYGHLSAYAPGLKEGMWVDRGQLIGFVGSTGRSTGPHLHFELLHKGVPTDPIVSPALRRPRLRGGELAQFRRKLARDREEARRDCAACDTPEIDDSWKQEARLDVMLRGDVANAPLVVPRKR